jgi:hypothetical protein
MADQPITEPLPTEDNTDTEKTRTYIHVLNGIWTHFSNVQAVKDISASDCMVTVIDITDSLMNIPLY